MFPFSLLFQPYFISWYDIFNELMLFTSQDDLIGKNCAQGLEYGPRAQTEGTVFRNTDRPRTVNNVSSFCARKQKENLQQNRPGSRERSKNPAAAGTNEIV